jgi:hypothetical protein
MRVCLVLFLAGLFQAQQAAPTDLVARASTYITEYEPRLGNLVAQEDYVQRWASPRRPSIQRNYDPTSCS